MYVPSTDPEPRMRLTVRTSGDARSVAAGLERVLQEIDSAVPVFGVRTVSAQIDETLRRERLLARWAQRLARWRWVSSQSAYTQCSAA
jgi:hypothetical protein